MKKPFHFLHTHENKALSGLRFQTGTRQFGKIYMLKTAVATAKISGKRKFEQFKFNSIFG
jgi:hypothetical protein